MSKEGDRLPAESQFPYYFATVYNCGLKGFSNLTQKASVNALLTNADPKAGEVRNLSDSVCSNYVMGKTDLGDDLRIELLSLDIPTIENRINLAGIQNLTKVAQSLHKLIEVSDLIKEDQVELVLSLLSFLFAHCHHLPSHKYTVYYEFFGGYPLMTIYSYMLLTLAIYPHEKTSVPFLPCSLDKSRLCQPYLK